MNIEKRIYTDGYYIHKASSSEVGYSRREVIVDPGYERLNYGEEMPVLAETSLHHCAQEYEVVSPGRLNKKRVIVQDTLKKNRKRHDGPKKFDEGKDVTKREREVPVAAQLGLTFGVISFACVGFLLVGGGLAALSVGLVSSLLGLGFSIGGLHVIKKDESKAGKGMATAGIILNLIFPLAAIAFIIFFLYVFAN